jgi:diphthine-ammonia ligase
VIHSDNDFASVAYLRIKSATLEDKEESSVNPTVPPVLEEPYEKIRETIQKYIQTNQMSVKRQAYSPQDAVVHFATSSRKLGGWTVISSVHRNLARQMPPASVEDEVTECFGILGGSHS